MKKINILLIGLFCLNILNSCGGLSDAGKVLRNEKVRTTDEFLVKKRDPLILPPEYEKIPKPDSISNSEQKENEIEKIINIQEEQSEKGKKSSSVEQSIINKIRK